MSRLSSFSRRRATRAVWTCLFAWALFQASPAAPAANPAKPAARQEKPLPRRSGTVVVPDRFLRWAAGRNGPAYGHLLDHPQLQPVIHVAPDGLTAQGRFRTLMMLGVHESAAATHEAGTFQRWESALYEDRYAKQDGGWRIAVIDLRHAWLCTYERGWAYSPIWEDYVSVCYPEDPDGPDEIAADDWRMWPDTRVLPFHYPHPVTGQWVLPTSGAAPAPE